MTQESAQELVDENESRVNGSVIGWIHAKVNCVSLIAEPHAEILGLVIGSGFRGKGTGRALILAAEEWCRAKGGRVVVFTSRVTREEAHRLYFSLDYKVIKTSHHFKKVLSVC